jgi:hypothetical protein
VIGAAEQVRFEQIPEYAPINHTGHVGGDFLFVPEAQRLAEGSQRGQQQAGAEIGRAELAEVATTTVLSRRSGNR